MRILVIDDDKEVRELICIMLRSEGYEVFEASNGSEGIKVIKKEPEFDIVITDLIMPEKEGIETISEIRNEYPNIKILAISGGGKGGTLNYLTIAKGMGADSTLGKPFVKQELIEAIQGLLDKI